MFDACVRELLNKIAPRYFFESDLLFRISLFRAKGVDIPMTAIYGSEKSNLRKTEVIVPFLVGNLRNFAKRICYNYFLRDFNVASLQLVFGFVNAPLFATCLLEL